MRNSIGEALADEWKALRHHQDHPQTAQETTVASRITEAKNAIDHAAQQLAGLTGNPLAEAIAEAGVGLAFQPDDVRLVLAMIRAIEHGPGTQQPQPVQPPIA